MSSTNIRPDAMDFCSPYGRPNVLRADKEYETDDYVVVVAIDIGAAFSRNAFSTKHDPTRVRAIRNRGAEHRFASYNTPTCVLFDVDGKFKSFGYSAQEEYALLSPEESVNYFYVDGLKLLLQDNSVGQISSYSPWNVITHPQSDERWFIGCNTRIIL